MNKIALAVHGGAGTILKSLMTSELEAEYRGGLAAALAKGREILEKGGPALEAVELTVCELEDFPLFNAGRGSVFTHEGKNEMDAALMDGRNLEAGAVAFVRNVKNPIRLARLVMERTEHILLAGRGADEFAREMQVELADDAYFYTDFRYQQLLKAREEGIVQLDHTADEVAGFRFPVSGSGNGSPVSENTQIFSPHSVSSAAKESTEPETGNRKPETRNPKPIGTVGAVACDRAGNLAAATSTGGMTNKKFGRVGDTPIIGAGTYAENRTCAVSCTGHGEYFMAQVTAYDVAARMKYKRLGLLEAARETIDELTAIGGEGGLIAVDALGNVTLPFNSEGMYRGYLAADGRAIVEIYR